MNKGNLMYIANFNCTFGEENTPMLTHFEDILLPAFLGEEVRKVGDTKYFFKDVRVTNLNGVYYLVGIFVKSTILEVKSRVIQGKLVNVDESHPTDPYSYFLINLKNHRMVLVKNQKGSPTLSNFSSTAKDILNKYIVKQNKNNDNKLPAVHLNIVAIPFKGAIEEELKKVEKITNIILRFYPLNGDIIDNETVKELTESLQKVGSNTGSLTYNTPKDKGSVAEIVEDTKGLMKPSIRVRYKNGTTGTLKSDSLTEVFNIELDEDNSIQQNFHAIAGKVSNENEFTETSEENKTIYSKFFTKIESIYKDFQKSFNKKGD